MRLLIFLIFFLTTPTIFAAVSFKMEKEGGATTFLAMGNPSAIRINGKGDGPQGTLMSQEKGELFILSGQLKVNLKSYDTGISLRDRHMKEKYLEVGKYEEAVLTIDSVAVPKAVLLKPSETKFPFAGILDLHGIKKNVTGDFTVNVGTEGTKITAVFQIKLSDYGIQVPSFAGITVADEVEVNATSNAKRIQ
ncbi:MAG: YceI family protein [Bdellovibrio sp.]